MPTRTVMNRPALAVLGTSAFFCVTAKALPVSLLPRIAHGHWPLLGGQG